jgi:alpha-D-ribose 1-methylphosphonate 5-triphosphate synthase subunit PhnG
MGLLARATRTELERAWNELKPIPAYELLRPTESGLVLVRGRTGGSGAPFNLGEMTMTRAAVRLSRGERPLGLSFVAGRDRRHAELAAVFDALLQQLAFRAVIDNGLLHKIAARLKTQRQARAAEVAATRVDFFTMVREQDRG